MPFGSSPVHPGPATIKQPASLPVVRAAHVAEVESVHVGELHVVIPAHLDFRHAEHHWLGAQVKLDE